MALEMIVVLCSVCGEPSVTGDASCRVCDADDRRAVPGPVSDATSEERLLESVEHSLDQLQTTPAPEHDHGVLLRRRRALRVRLEAQRGELATRIRGDHAHTEGGDRRALGLVKRELGRSL